MHTDALLSQITGDPGTVALLNRGAGLVRAEALDMDEPPPVTGWPEAVETLLAPTRSPEERATAVEQLYPLFLTDKGEPRKRPHSTTHGKKGMWDPARWAELRELIPPLGAVFAPIRDQWISWSERLEQRAANLCVAVAALARRLRSDLEQRKDAEGWLDFTDQLRLATRLVEEHPQDVAAALAQRFSAILIDEFQDTDPLQWRLALGLLEATEVGHPRVMLVGDPRQSIYRFRGAEVRAFPEAAQELKGQVGADEFIHVRMEDNFRSSPALVHAVDGLMADLIPRATAQTEAPMRAPHMIPRPSEAKWPSGLHLLAVPKETNDSGSHATEAEAIANTIRALVDNPDKWRGEVWVSREAEAFSPRLGDIAILLRVTTHLAEIEHALRRAKIPFHVGGGAGLAHRQEIRDLAHLLRTLTEPTDDHALLGLLRTPWMGWSDDLLVKVTLLTCGLAPRQPPPLWQRLKSVERVEHEGISLSEEDWDCIQRTRRLLRRAIARCHHTSPAEVAEEILTATGAWTLVRLESEGRRRLANLRRALAQLQSRGGKGFDSVQAAAEMLRRLVTREARIDEEQLVSPGEDAVRLLTVHGAKGLEFPIVILPQLQRAQRLRESSDDWIWSRHWGLGVKTNNPDNDWKREPSALMRLALHREKREQVAEEARLLYVAMTRAEQMLIVSGAVKGRLDEAVQAAEKSSPLEWILEGMRLQPGDLTKPEILPPWNGAEAVPVLSPERCQALAGPPREERVIHEPALRITPQILSRVAALPEEPNPERPVSITALASFAHCPNQHFLGREADVRDVSQLLEEKSESAKGHDASLVGSLFHLWADMHLTHPDQTAQTVAERFSQITGQTSGPEVVSHVEQLWTKLLRAPLGQELRQLEELHTEHTVLIATPEGPLRGRIDLLAKRSGLWEVIDWKTGARDHGDRPPESHRIQMLCYLLFLSAHAPGQRAYTARLVYPAQGTETAITLTPGEVDAARREISALVRRFKVERGWLHPPCGDPTCLACQAVARPA